MTEKEICELLEKKQYKTVKEAFAEMNEVDLAELLEELPEKERTLISLRYFQEKTQTQVAEVLGISQVQVSRLEKKILRKLRLKI